MARLEPIGAFALTEPDHCSDSVGLESRARRDGRNS
jgi:glutaryl-CoA dehydrogenase